MKKSSCGHVPGGGKKDDKDKKKKYEPPVPTTVGKKKRTKEPDAASKLPLLTPNTQCPLKLLKLKRMKDYLLKLMKPLEEKQEEERSKVDDLSGTPMSVGTLEEIISDHYVYICGLRTLRQHFFSFVDKDLLKPGCLVLLSHKVHAVEKSPQEICANTGEIKESVELPLTHPEYYEEMGIKPPKGVILYGPPGTGKILLAIAVGNQTSTTFLRVVGSELIQKYLGDGPEFVWKLFRVSEEHAPSIVFIDEIDAIGTKIYDSNSGETLDPALIRPGHIDRNIEFPLPDEKTRKHIFQIHTNRMTLADDTTLDDLIMAKDDLSGADIKVTCRETSKKSKENILYKKQEGSPERLYLW
uniref:AAA+ ATPase domain-containing protein n=1 Tax=Gorilla gorilla gorilla TaxID=9595 RepID=A0A2I2YXJ1_GORGO